MIVDVAARLPETLEELLGPGLAGRLDALDVVSRKVMAGKMPGERRSKRRGRSVEFDDFREYVPGDDPRHIDWNACARLDRLIVKLFREEEDLSLRLLVDASASMQTGSPSKLAFTLRLAMALAYVGLVKQNRVSVAVFGRERWPGGVRALAPLRGRASAQRVGAFLLSVAADIRASGPGPAGVPSEALRTILRGRAERGVSLLASDFHWEEGAGPAMAYLGAGVGLGGADAYALRVLSPSELDPAAEPGLSGDLRLTDAESARAAEVTVTPASIAAYRAALEADTRRLRETGGARGVALFQVRSDAPVDEIVLGTLRRGGMLG